MNNYSAIGRLTRDPETKYTTSGKAVTSFDLAVDVGYGQNKKTIFWPCKLWGDRGENFAKYVAKGNQVGIEASIDQEEWTDKGSGEQRRKLVLVVNNFTLLSNGDKAQQGGGEKRVIHQKTPERAAQNDDFGSGPITDGLDGDDIPF